MQSTCPGSREPRLRFIGYVSSIACQLTSGRGAWLSQLFRGELTLPAVSEMEREVARVHAWADQLFPARNEGHFIGPFLAHYIDELLCDMGLRTFRTRHVLSEYMSPIWPLRYRDIAEERRRARTTPVPHAN